MRPRRFSTEDVRPEFGSRDTCDGLNLSNPLDGDRRCAALPSENGCTVHLEQVRNAVERQVAILTEFGKGCLRVHTYTSGIFCHSCKGPRSHFVQASRM